MSRHSIAARFVLTSLALIFWAPPGRAADSTPMAPRRVVFQDTVVVQAVKLPFRLDQLATSGSVIPASQIRLGTARSLQDALAPVPGAHILDLSGSDTQGSVESRGFASQGTSSHMLVLVDEIPINEFETDRVDWNVLGLGQVDRIEFLRGPASFLYGNASMAGVVNLVTQAPGRTSLWAQTSGGSWGRGAGSGGVGWSGRRAQSSLSLSGQRLDGWREHSKFASWSGYGSLRWALSPRWDLRGRLLGQHEDLDAPGPLDSTQFHDNPRQAGTPLDHRRGRMVGSALELTGRVSPTLGVVGLFSSDQRVVDATETIVPVGTLDRFSDTGVMGGELRLHWAPAIAWTPHVLFGGDIHRGTLRSEYAPPGSPSEAPLLSEADVTRLSGGTFTVFQLRPGTRVSLSGGARLDWLRSTVDRHDGAGEGPHDDLSAFSPTAGLGVDLPSIGHAYASYAGSFKAPTIEQLYDTRPFDIGLGFPITISYNALQPQRADHGELGLRSRLGAWLASDLAVYLARARNEIGFDLATFHHSNIDRSTHYGMEASLQTVPGRRGSGQLSYAFTRAVFDGGPHDGKQINTVPKHQLQARLSISQPLGGTFTVEGVYVRDQWADEDNTVSLDPYFIAGLGASQPLGPFELFGSVRNLFDDRYAALGYVSLGGPLYFPGAARSFEIGLRVRAPRIASEVE